jgi:hypothetical protein
MGSDAILRRLQVVDGEWVVHDEHDPARISARWQLLAMPREAGHIRPHVRKRLDELVQAGGRVIDGVPVAAAALEQAGIRRWSPGPVARCAGRPAGWSVFEATLRVSGRAPELFNPVTGGITVHPSS